MKIFTYLFQMNLKLEIYTKNNYLKWDSFHFEMLEMNDNELILNGRRQMNHQLAQRIWRGVLDGIRAKLGSNTTSKSCVGWCSTLSNTSSKIRTSQIWYRDFTKAKWWTMFAVWSAQLKRLGKTLSWVRFQKICFEYFGFRIDLI